MNWLTIWNFGRNPFDTNPVALSTIDMYIDREMVKKTVNAITGYTRGRFVVIGETGVGKSSTLNYINHQLKQADGALIITFNAGKADSDEYIYDWILDKIMSSIPPGLYEQVRSRCVSLNIIEKMN